MTYELKTSGIIGANPIPVAVENNNSALAIALEGYGIEINGKDKCGYSLPLEMKQDVRGMGANTWGRFIRLKTKNDKGGFFFDIGIDADGNLFINASKGPQVNDATVHNFKFYQDGSVEILGDLIVNGKVIQKG